MFDEVTQVSFSHTGKLRHIQMGKLMIVFIAFSNFPVTLTRVKVTDPSMRVIKLDRGYHVQ